MRYFITGGAGFIGSHFVRRLLKSDHNQVSGVTVFDKLTYSGNVENLSDCQDDSRFHLQIGDICDSSVVKEVIKNHDVVVNFAAESHVDRSIETSHLFVLTNVLGTHTLLEQARQAEIPLFIQVSTDEVYGSRVEGSWSEEELLLPNSPYAASKASGDLIARSFHQTYGMDVRITRCSNNFGTHQYPEKIIPLFITNLIDGKKVPLYGNGENIRDWLHVEDHCKAIQLVIERGKRGEIYNVGGGTELTNLELTMKLLNLFDLSSNFITYVEDRQGHDFRYSVDWRKINRELGYEPSHSLTDELPNLVKWYENNENWWRPLISVKS